VAERTETLPEQSPLPVREQVKIERPADRSAAVEKANAGPAYAQMLGLHPMVAFGMVAADMMLFGGEAATAGVGLAVTIPVALALTLPCILLQRYSFGDGWGAAVGKGLMVGVLTAIPFPIGSPLTILGAVLGWRSKKK
jgi:hypothetical protein